MNNSKILALITLSGIIALPSPLLANPLKKAVEAVGDTASAIGDSIGDTVDTVRGERTPEIVRNEIDIEEKKALLKLFDEQPAAKRLFDSSYGYAVFDSSKKGFMLSSASGTGVAVHRGSNKRTYMQMASLGANLGGGIQYFKVVFLFQDSKSFNYFVDKGWEAGGAADAVFGKDAASADIEFVNGKAIFELNETGIMLGANISGTKYWKSSELNGETEGEAKAEG